MAGVKLTFAAIKGQLEDAIEAKYRPIAAAVTAAIKDTAAFVKAQGRADIASALGPKFANSWRVNVYPSGGRSSAGAAVYAFSRIRYAGVFETGASIHGKPTLWIPLPNAPKRIGRQRITPALYVARVGPLRLVQRPGHRPLLVADIRVGRRTAVSGRRVFALSTLRRGGAAGAKGAVISVPMFFGIDAVGIRKRIHIQRIAQQARDRIPSLFAKHLDPEG